MKVIAEENNLEVEVIGIEDLEEMKLKLYSIEKKISSGTATNEEVKFVIDVIKNTGDYSDILKTPGQKDFEFSAKSDFQANGSLLEAVDKINASDDNQKRIKDTLAHMDHWLKLSRINNRIRSKALDIYLKAGTRKVFKKELDSFFELLSKRIKANEIYAKKWLQ